MTAHLLSTAGAYPFGQIVLEGAAEIIGRDHLLVFLNQSGLAPKVTSEGTLVLEMRLSERNLVAFQQWLEETFGQSGGRGTILQIGRAANTQLFHQFGDRLGVKDSRFRLLPTRKRLYAGLQSLADLLSDLCSHRFEVAQDNDAFHWHLHGCPWCLQRQVASVVCYFWVGLFQEYLSWLSGGKYYNVVENACIGMGRETCSFRIDKQAVE
jgi:predicted hydrocarbon binding protein